MVESVKAKAERSIFSNKKGTILSDLIPHLKLPHEPLFAKIDEQIVKRKRKIIGARPHFYSKIKKWKEIKNGAWPQLFSFFLGYGDSVDLRRF